MYFGINGGVNFRNFDFSFVFSGNLNNKVYNAKKQARNASNRQRGSQLRQRPVDGRQPLQHQRPAPSPSSMPNSTFFLESGSYLRLTNVVMGYTVPGEPAGKGALATVRIFLSGQNCSRPPSTPASRRSWPAAPSIRASSWPAPHLPHQPHPDGGAECLFSEFQRTVNLASAQPRHLYRLL